MLDTDKLRVTSIQRLCVNDGPGVRTTVFLKGCYLHCPWCCNPETIHYSQDEYFDKGVCKHSAFFCSPCELNGGTISKKECPIGNFEKSYKDYSVEELYELLVHDDSIYKEGGGITFSGGEPLLQAESLRALFAKLKEHHIHIAFESSLYAPYENLQMVVSYVDYWLVDLKLQYGFIENHDYVLSKDDFSQNLAYLQSQDAKVRYRMVVMSEINEKKTYIVQQLKELGVTKIELLAYHSLARNKYKQLGKIFHEFTVLSESEMEEWSSCLNDNNINVTFLKI